MKTIDEALRVSLPEVAESGGEDADAAARGSRQSFCRKPESSKTMDHLRLFRKGLAFFCSELRLETAFAADSLPMRVRILFFGMLKDLAGSSSETLELPEGSSVSDLLKQYEARIPIERLAFISGRGSESGICGGGDQIEIRR